MKLTFTKLNEVKCEDNDDVLLLYFKGIITLHRATIFNVKFGYVKLSNN